MNTQPVTRHPRAMTVIACLDYRAAHCDTLRREGWELTMRDGEVVTMPHPGSAMTPKGVRSLILRGATEGSEAHREVLRLLYRHSPTEHARVCLVDESGVTI